MRRGRRRSRSHSASEVVEDQTSVVYRQPQPEEGVQLGCAMLGKIRYRVPDPTARVPMRCALGYALRDEDDVARCLAVSGPSECWKGEANWRVYPVQFSANGHAPAGTSDLTADEPVIAETPPPAA